jgi:flagellar motor switch protein FliN/FliY
MATQPQLEAGGRETPVTADLLAEQANMALMQSAPEGSLPQSQMARPEFACLPISLDVAVPFPGFRVRDLITLEPGQVIETEWASGEDMPLSAGRVQLVWTEFEVVDQRIAVRVTRMV